MLTRDKNQSKKIRASFRRQKTDYQDFDFIMQEEKIFKAGFITDEEKSFYPPFSPYQQQADHRLGKERESSVQDFFWQDRQSSLHLY